MPILAVRWKVYLPDPRTIAAYFCFAILFSWAALEASYLFQRPTVQLARFPFVSDEMRPLSRLPLIANISLPIPYAYLEGLDLLNKSQHIGKTMGNLYQLGEVR